MANFPGMGPGGVNMPSLCKKSTCFMHFRLSVIVLGISVSHFLEMTMLISYVVTLNQIR